MTFWQYHKNNAGVDRPYLPNNQRIAGEMASIYFLLPPTQTTFLHVNISKNLIFGTSTSPPKKLGCPSTLTGTPFY